MSCIKGFGCLLEVVVLVLTDLGEFTSALLKLEQIVLGSFDLCISGGILTFSLAILLTKMVNLLLVSGTLFFEFLKLKVGGVNIFADGI